MKTKLIAFAVVSMFFFTGYSQGINFGLKAGASMNKITGKSFKEEFSYGYHAGGFVTVKLGKKLAIQPELLFNQVNVDTSSKFSSVYQFNHINHIKLGYLSIPILLNYNLANILALQAGPQFGVLIDQNKNLLKNGGDAFDKGDFSMIGGVQVKLSKLRLYGRYVVGLNDISNIGSSDKWKSQSIQFGVGVAL